MASTAEDEAEEEAIVAQDLLRQYAVAVVATRRKKSKIDSRLLPRQPKRNTILGFTCK